MNITRTMRIILNSTGEYVDFTFKYTIPHDIQDSSQLGLSKFCNTLEEVLESFINRLFSNRFDYRAHGDTTRPGPPDEATRIRTEEDEFMSMLPNLIDQNIFFVDNSASRVELFKYIITKGTEEALEQNKCATAFGILINHGMISVEDITPPPEEEQAESSDDSSNMKRPHEDSSTDDGDDENNEAPDEKKPRTDEND